MDENSKQALEEWKADTNAWGDLDRDYFNYVGDYIENEAGSAEDMLTFDAFCEQEYQKFLLEVHQDDALDDEDEPFPGSDDE